MTKKLQPLIVLALWGIITATAFADNALLDAVIGGQVKADFRLRYEQADLDGSKTSDALTLRSRVGYGTRAWHGLSAYVEFEDVSAFNGLDNYNQAGLNPSNGDYTVIADIEGTEINQAYINITAHESNLRLGSQRVILDNARFVGNVGWRQNEQTYDAASLKNSAIENVDIYYAYLAGVRRIFGQENGSQPAGEAGNAAQFDSDAHLANISYKPCDFFTATVYGYLLDLGDGTSAAMLSSDTYGIRLAASHKPDNGPAYIGAVEYANQQDNSATTVGKDYSATYIRADLTATLNPFSIGGGYELLGSDDGAAFTTPLATGHKFNGWADLFLVTPAAGLEDIFVSLGAKCPRGYNATAIYHVFSSDTGGIDYGTELDAVISKEIGKHVKLVAKYAHFEANSDPDNPKASDLDRVSAEINFTF